MAATQLKINYKWHRSGLSKALRAPRMIFESHLCTFDYCLKKLKRPVLPLPDVRALPSPTLILTPRCGPIVCEACHPLIHVGSPRHQHGCLGGLGMDWTDHQTSWQNLQIQILDELDGHVHKEPGLGAGRPRRLGNKWYVQ